MDRFMDENESVVSSRAASPYSMTSQAAGNSPLTVEQADQYTSTESSSQAPICTQLPDTSHATSQETSSSYVRIQPALHFGQLYETPTSGRESRPVIVGKDFGNDVERISNSWQKGTEKMQVKLPRLEAVSYDTGNSSGVTGVTLSHAQSAAFQRTQGFGTVLPYGSLGQSLKVTTTH